MLKLYDSKTSNLSIESFLKTCSLFENPQYLINNIKNTFNKVFKKQYILKLDSYFYDHRQKTYVIVFRIRNKCKVFSLNINDVFYKDKNFLNSVHPVDAYVIGVIFGMKEHNIIHSNNYLQEYKDFNNYEVMSPTVEIIRQNMLDPYHDILIKPIAGNNPIKVSIFEISKNPFLLQALGSQIAAKIGLYISYFFAEQEGQIVHLKNLATA